MIGFSPTHTSATNNYQLSIRFASAAQSSPILPVTAVPPVRAMGRQTSMPIMPSGLIGASLPFVREGVDPVEMAVRNRIQYLDPLQQDNDTVASAAEEEKSMSAAEAMEESTCQTCEKRKYQDGSDDPGVSFKTATHLSPEQAATAVRGHEMEHVSRERAKADREDRRVVQQSVTIHTAICPECGDVYVSGGTTRTITAKDNRQERAIQARQALLGRTLDTLV